MSTNQVRISKCLDSLPQAVACGSWSSVERAGTLYWEADHSPCQVEWALAPGAEAAYQAQLAVCPHKQRGVLRLSLLLWSLGFSPKPSDQGRQNGVTPSAAR